MYTQHLQSSAIDAMMTTSQTITLHKTTQWSRKTAVTGGMREQLAWATRRDSDEFAAFFRDKVDSVRASWASTLLYEVPSRMTPTTVRAVCPGDCWGGGTVDWQCAVKDVPARSGAYLGLQRHATRCRFSHPSFRGR